MPKYLTPEGLEKLKKELEQLKGVKRREIAERLKQCIAFGDLSENAEYFETKEAQSFLEGRILELEELIRGAVVVSNEKQKNLAQIGSTILVSSQWKKEKFKIVGVEEVDPVKGKISSVSPLGKAVLNQSIGTTVEVYTPEGKVQYKILKIE